MVLPALPSTITYHREVRMRSPQVQAILVMIFLAAPAQAAIELVVVPSTLALDNVSVMAATTGAVPEAASLAVWSGLGLPVGAVAGSRRSRSAGEIHDRRPPSQA
jgi:hypothetical protein